MYDKKKSTKQTITWSIIGSLSLHIFFTLGFFWGQFESKTETSPNILEFVRPEDLLLPEISEEQPEKKPIYRQRNQIVSQDEKQDSVSPPPEDTRFLGARDQTVLKETRARNTGRFENHESVSSSKPKLRDLRTQAGLALERQRTEKYNASSSATDDYLRDITPGDQTLLNTREFLYHSYYMRIKDRLRPHWEPRIKSQISKLVRQGRRLASERDHITRLIIVLNADGSVRKIQVLGASGVEDLDEAAISAFESAAPFPNPPKGLIEQDDSVRIRWDFIIET